MATGIHLLRFLAVGGGLPILALASPPNVQPFGGDLLASPSTFYELFSVVAGQAVLISIVIALIRLSFWPVALLLSCAWVFVHWVEGGVAWLVDPGTRLGFDLALLAVFAGVHYMLRENGPIFRNRGARFGAFAPHQSMIRAVYSMTATASLELLLMAWQVAS